MRRVQLENTALQVSRLGFGTAQLHHVHSRPQRIRLLEAAFDAGFTHFDTSPYYGFGMAESDLGHLLHGRRDRVTVATKVGLYAPGDGSFGSPGVYVRKALGKLAPQLSAPVVDWSVQAAERSLNESLKRLRTDHVDVVFLHEPEPGLVPAQEFLAWLEREKSKGKLLHWGLAGLRDALDGWLTSCHPLAMILQSQDSRDRNEADLVLKHGRKLQFTYGYLSGIPSADRPAKAEAALRWALQRNTGGAVLVSTRKRERVAGLAAIAG
ncbi:MAG: aldo/keto reductase [Planctomycetota bacterium]